MNTLTATAIGDILDLDRYPLDRLDSPRGQLLVESCRAALRFEGACQLPGLLKQDAIEKLVAESVSKQGQAYKTDNTHNVYFEAPDHDAPSTDPSSLLQHSSKKAVAWDLIDAQSPLRIAYEWDGLTNFIGQAMEADQLYRYADPLGACSLMMFEDGDELGWHFDRSPFAVTLMLQPSAEGGEYQYFHRLRSSEDENKAGVAERINGSDEGRIKLSSEPGTLSMFRGQYSMHRVTPVTGGQLRINAVLAYSEKPNDKLNTLTQQLFYGRSA
ncbi:hypothetical protein FCN77_12860 [Arthrobacter sp. 24S4-2]|uniref:HalD/BesD family halogenase n=1 Tax=Arthrobacter sp. 24S4-2 TaxID=2575374 RepID=UPI0010C7B132|nr:hypothetical protein [Arthrobacter sp. 24S4-2]QCO98416.1 hypothetical protein FCN77_12860 [Arthrobacter sp. 24S4-2]